MLDQISSKLPKHLDEYGRLVMSGLLAEQASAISRIYSKDLRLEPELSEELDGWRALLLRGRQ